MKRIKISTGTTIANHCGIVVLAAGSSSRLGKPKQLLFYKGKSLVQRVAQVALGSMAGPVIIVTGSSAELVKKELSGYNVTLIENKEWQEGMASSIRCGLNLLLQVAPSTDAVILMVCDQPFVTTQLLDDLLKTQQETGQPIVTSLYKNISGPPALFYKTVFPELLTLKGEAGARKIVEHHANEMVSIPFPQGIMDIDTEEDYQALH